MSSNSTTLLLNLSTNHQLTSKQAIVSGCSSLVVEFSIFLFASFLMLLFKIVWLHYLEFNLDVYGNPIPYWTVTCNCRSRSNSNQVYKSSQMSIFVSVLLIMNLDSYWHGSDTQISLDDPYLAPSMLTSEINRIHRTFLVVVLCFEMNICMNKSIDFLDWQQHQQNNIDIG